MKSCGKRDYFSDMSNSFVGSFWDRVTYKTEQFWNGRLYFPVMLAAAAVSMLSGNVVPSTVLLAVLCGWMLVFCRDILAAALPFLLIFLLSTLQYTSLSVFLPCAPLAVLPIGGLLVHLFHWKKPVVAGKSAVGLAAVAAATVLGGVGAISAGEYFAPLSLYYILGLGPGLLVTYLLLRSELEMPHSYDLMDRLMQMLYTIGLAMVLAIACFYAENWAAFADNWEIPCIPYRNFAATILVSTLPAVFSLVRRSRWYLAAVLLWGAALFFSGSRTALLFGAVMMLLGMLYLLRRRVLPFWAFFAALATAAVAALLLGHQIQEIFLGGRGEPDVFIGPHEPRWALLARSWDDFRQHPLFGIGLGSQKNTDLFKGIPGSMVFYHNAPAQILGSMGLAGVAAYGLLLANRIRLLLRGGEAYILVGMYYTGMLLVSMTNPGLFCPLPNAALTVLVFSVLEKCVGDPACPPGKAKL